MATVTDIDGNVYETVQIGEQVWMAENLKVTHYNNPNESNNYLGDEIPTGYPDGEWVGITTGAFSIYPADSPDDNSDWSEITCGDDCADDYGNLYNWYAVDDERSICPEGWHVPNNNDCIEIRFNPLFFIFSYILLNIFMSTAYGST